MIQMNIDDALVKDLAKAIDDSDLLGCGCCAGGYDYDRYENRAEAIAAEVVAPLLAARTERRFCTLRFTCGLANGHKGECRP